MSSIHGCSAPVTIPGKEADAADPNQVGRTPMNWVVAISPGTTGTIDGIPLWKPSCRGD